MYWIGTHNCPESQEVPRRNHASAFSASGDRAAAVCYINVAVYQLS